MGSCWRESAANLNMAGVRVKRGGLSLVLHTNGGKTLIGMSTGQADDETLGISCSIVGLYNVLSGVEYHCVDGGRHCLIRLVDDHIEVIWRRDTMETIFRLAVGEYRNILRAVSHGSQAA